MPYNIFKNQVYFDSADTTEDADAKITADGGPAESYQVVEA